MKFSVFVNEGADHSLKIFVMDNRLCLLSSQAAAVAQVGYSNPSRDRPNSLKQVVIAPLPNARH